MALFPLYFLLALAITILIGLEMSGNNTLKIAFALTIFTTAVTIFGMLVWFKKQSEKNSSDGAKTAEEKQQIGPESAMTTSEPKFDEEPTDEYVQELPEL